MRFLDSGLLARIIWCKQSHSAINDRTFLGPDGCPVGVNWRYDRAEILSDGIVHAVGLSLALIGAITLLVVSSQSTQGLEAAYLVIH